MKEWMVSEAESGAQSFRYVTRILPGAPVGLLRKSLRKKNITLNGKKMTGQEKLKGGDRICVWFSEDTLQKFMVPKAVEEVKPVVPGFASLIVYEDPKVMILNKPAGLLSQGDGKGTFRGCRRTLPPPSVLPSATGWTGIPAALWQRERPWRPCRS